MPYIGNIVQDFSVNTAMLNSDSVTSIKIDDGTIVNADINDSAAIAGTKISPNFGSQNTTTTGIGAFGELQVTSTAPKITFFDSDTNPDFEIRNLHGVLHFKDVSSTAVRMQINTDGHVDILGNLDVGAGLDVTGAITLQTNNPNIRFDDSDTNNNGEITLDNTQLRIEVDEDEAVDNSAIKFRIDNSDKAIIDSSGNVGIGTTSPGGKLDVRGTIFVNGDGSGGRIFASSGNLSLSDGNGRQVLRIDDPGTGNSHSHIFDSNGRLGIGTTSPDAQLEVSSSSFSTEIKISTSDLQDAVGNVHGQLVFEGRNNSGTVYESAQIQSICESSAGTRRAGLGFLTAGSTPGNLTEKLRITNDGKVGIGTTSPVSDIHTASSSDHIITHQSTTTGADIRMNFRDSGNTDKGGIHYLFNGNSLKFITAESERMRIDSSGKVGIATTSPLALLDVNLLNSGARRLLVSYADSLITVQGANSSSTNENLRITGDNLIFSSGSGTGTEQMRIDSSGDVLINRNTSINVASTATSKLQVHHSAGNISAAFYSTADALGPSGVLALGHARGSNSGVLQDNDLLGQIRFAGGDGNDLATIGASIDAEVNGTPSGNVMPTDLVFQTNAGSGSTSERMRLLKSGGLTFNGDTATANALDDYEEGDLSWQLRKHNTPSLGTDNGSVVKYTKVGRLVHISGRIRTDSTGSAGNDNFLLVGTLPFTPATAGTNPIGHWRSQDGLGIVGSFAWAASSTTVYIYQVAVQNDYAADENNVGAKTQTNLVVTFSLTYQSV